MQLSHPGLIPLPEVTQKMFGNPVCVAPTGDRCSEGPVWHEAHASVYWADINLFLIHRFGPADQTVRSWFFDEPVTGFCLTDRDDVLAVLPGSCVILWEPATGLRREQIFTLDTWPRVRLNDGRADPRGSLWVGSMRNNVQADGSSAAAGGKDGVLYRLDPGGRVTKCRSDIGISNTIAWSPDQTHFYFGDSLANTVWRFDYDQEDGNISNEIPFLTNFDRGSPDGSDRGRGRLSLELPLPWRRYRACCAGREDRSLNRNAGPKRYLVHIWRDGSNDSLCYDGCGRGAAR